MLLDAIKGLLTVLALGCGVVAAIAFGMYFWDVIFYSVGVYCIVWSALDIWEKIVNYLK